jgi:pseudouridine-5'-phosphate glycosidase
LPFPLNIETAQVCEAAVKQHLATPATIGVIAGVPAVGLTATEMQCLAEGSSPNGRPIEKVSLNNLAGVMVQGRWGATTVASSLQIAHLAGLRVFSTGGIGGVHRGAAQSFDLSADLTALARFPVVCVCAGAKAVLDLARTLEALETLGVPVVGYGADEFPAFYSRESGFAVNTTVDSARGAAELAWRHWQAGMSTAVVVCVPLPEQHALPREEMERIIEQAIESAAKAGVRGKTLTPFLLSEVDKLSGGRALAANRALLVNNAEVAAQIAVSASKIETA